MNELINKDDSTISGVFKLLGKDYKRLSIIGSNGNAYRCVIKSITNAGFRAIFLYRWGRWFYLNNFNFLASICQRVMHHTAHCWISVAAQIGPGFLIAHVGGIVIGGQTIIGSNCDIRQNVTFGGNFNKESPEGRTQPKLGDNISVGAGAVILGPIKVGSYSIIGANSVVNRDVPDNVIVLGVPAKILRSRWDDKSGRKLL